MSHEMEIILRTIDVDGTEKDIRVSKEEMAKFFRQLEDDQKTREPPKGGNPGCPQKMSVSMEGLPRGTPEDQFENLREKYPLIPIYESLEEEDVPESQQSRESVASSASTSASGASVSGRPRHA